MTEDARMRIGLVGTGYWARETHAPGIDGAPDAALTAVWGRNPDSHGHPCPTPRGNRVHGLRRVPRAGRCGLLLCPARRPGAPLPFAPPRLASIFYWRSPSLLMSRRQTRSSHQCRRAVSRRWSSSRTCSPLQPRHWFRSIDDAEWLGGDAYWLGSALCDDNPFNTPWRRRYGGLWDVGPHAVADLWRALGPIVKVTADSGAPDVTHLVLHHESGASSTCTLTLSAPDAADGFTMMLWGAGGRAHLPIDEVDSLQAHTVAVQDLVALGRVWGPRTPSQPGVRQRCAARPRCGSAPARHEGRGHEIAAGRPSLAPGMSRWLRARFRSREQARFAAGHCHPWSARALRASAWTATSTPERSGRSGSNTHSRPGYSMTSEVVDVGPDASGIAIGDRVATSTPHQLCLRRAGQRLHRCPRVGDQRAGLLGVAGVHHPTWCPARRARARRERGRGRAGCSRSARRAVPAAQRSAPHHRDRTWPSRALPWLARAAPPT